MWSWLARHWKTFATIGCSVAAAGTLPINPLLTALIGGVCVAAVQNRDASAPPKK